MSPSLTNVSWNANAARKVCGVCPPFDIFRYSRSSGRYLGLAQFSIIVSAFCIGDFPRKSAMPCSVIIMSTECSLWSKWETMGTIALISPPFATDGQLNIDVYALRVKSAEPPMPFIIFVPTTCVEFTFPNMSASRAVFIVMTPSRRITSGLFDISAGRMITLSWKRSMFSKNSFMASVENVMEHVLAKRHLPDSISLSTESWMTSVYISNGGMSALASRRASTAFAILPTPDCNGRNELGMRPSFSSLIKKLHTFSPIIIVVSSLGANGCPPSGKLVFTMPTIFSGSICSVGVPAKSLGL